MISYIEKTVVSKETGEEGQGKYSSCPWEGYSMLFHLERGLGLFLLSISGYEIQYFQSFRILILLGREMN